MNLHAAAPQPNPTLDAACLSGPTSSESRVEIVLGDLSQQIRNSLQFYHAGLDLPKPLGTALISARDAQLAGGPALFRTCKALISGHAALVPSMHSAQSPELQKFLDRLKGQNLHAEIKPCFIQRRLFLEINVLDPSQLPEA
jgi:hypothetical protein